MAFNSYAKIYYKKREAFWPLFFLLEKLQVDHFLFREETVIPSGQILFGQAGVGYPIQRHHIIAQVCEDPSDDSVSSHMDFKTQNSSIQRQDLHIIHSNQSVFQSQSLKNGLFILFGQRLV